MLGVPVIADATPHVIEAVQGHKLGIVLESRPAWGVYLRQLLTEPQLRKTFHENALKFSKKFLTPRALGLTMVDFFLSAYGRRLPNEVVEQCGAMLARARERGEEFERMESPPPASSPKLGC